MTKQWEEDQGEDETAQEEQQEQPGIEFADKESEVDLGEQQQRKATSEQDPYADP